MSNVKKTTQIWCAGLVCGSLLLALPSPRAAAEVLTVPLSPSHQCTRTLLEQAGRIGGASAGLPALYRRFSVRQDEDFLQILAAVIFVESRFEAKARSEVGALGLMQVTVDAAAAAANSCSLRHLLKPESLLDSATNIRYGSCYLSQLLRETDGDLDRALIAYNGGYRQLQKYDAGQPIVAETANYVLSVRRALKQCSVTSH